MGHARLSNAARGLIQQRFVLVRRAALVTAFALAAPALGCDGCRKDTPSGPVTVDAAPPPSPAPLDAEAPVDAGVVEDAATAGDAAARLELGDGGAACKLVWGPEEQPFHGPATLAVDGATLLVVTNDSGRPRVRRVPVSPPAPPSKPTAAPSMSWPPCEIAGSVAYCHGRGSTVVRAPLEGAGGREVSTAAGNARLAAAQLGKDHTVVAYVQRHQTTEGPMLQAFATLDEGEAVRLSDDGAGATSLRLVPLGPDRALAVYIDARTAMVPVHARTLSVEGGRLKLGEDVVVFVGGPPERGVDFTVARAGDKSLVLLPNAKDSLAFGMAAVALAEPMREDMPAVWSMYPNGLDPAPIAATTEPSDSAYVARIRPLTRDPKSERVLELGRVDAAGAYTSLGVVETGKPVTDVDIAVDKTGAVWVVYGDTKTTWLGRWACPR